MEDIYYENQRVYCNNNKVPLFAFESCSHRYKWVGQDIYGHNQSLGEMLVQKFGEDEAFKISAGTHIIGCPTCGRSWCD
jgi:hypothetical protein